MEDYRILTFDKDGYIIHNNKSKDCNGEKQSEIVRQSMMSPDGRFFLIRRFNKEASSEALDTFELL